MKKTPVLYEGLDTSKLYEIPNYTRYLADFDNGRIWDKEKQRWVIANPNFNKYCLANVVDDDGKRGSVGVHVLIMRALFAIDTGYFYDWEAKGLEVDHLDFDQSNNNVHNLHLKPIPVNRARRAMPATVKRLDTRVIAELRKQYKTLQHGTKMEWFEAKGKEYGVSFRCIQDNCLGYINKDVI